MELIVTAPSVVYKAVTTKGDELWVDSPVKLPDADKRKSVSEPYVRMEILTPQDYTGTLMELCQNRRGEVRTTVNVLVQTVEVVWRVTSATRCTFSAICCFEIVAGVHVRTLYWYYITVALGIRELYQLHLATIICMHAVGNTCVRSMRC
jgi:Elongation factor G C-terminus